MSQGWRHIIAAIVLATAPLAFACSGNDKESTFGSETNNEPARDYDAGNFFDDVRSDRDTRPSQCAPDPTTSYSPTWRPPTAFKQGACTQDEIDGYYQACLANIADPAPCAKFAADHAGCTKCIESKDTDANLGPVVWRQKRSYVTMNVEGCIARTLNNLDPNACGALYSAAIDCKRSLCSSCFELKEPSYQKFQTCQDSAKDLCQTYTNAWNDKCPVLRTTENNPGAADQCFPKENTTKGAYFALAPLFCGK
jgi:hypothetical protein